MDIWILIENENFFLILFFLLISFYAETTFIYHRHQAVFLWYFIVCPIPLHQIIVSIMPSKRFSCRLVNMEQKKIFFFSRNLHTNKNKGKLVQYWLLYRVDTRNLMHTTHPLFLVFIVEWILFVWKMTSSFFNKLEGIRSV